MSQKNWHIINDLETETNLIAVSTSGIDFISELNEKE